MTVEKDVSEEEEEEKRKVEWSCILVGVQIDGNGRELLDWALTKVAREGDRVVAVHVCRNKDLSNTSTLSFIKELDDYLSEYEGLCSMKKLVLVGRVSRGSSIRKALVKEAKLCAAMTVVVGVIKTCSLGGSASVAKYCAKKLPPATSLIAVHKGKVIFERGSTKAPSEDMKPSLGSFLHPSVGMNPQVIIPSSKVQPVIGTPRSSDFGLGDGREKGVSSNASSTVSVLVRKLPEATPGWPLLRKVVQANFEASKDSEARKMSVVQWVMKLPDRSPSSIQSSASIDLVNELETTLGAHSTSCKWYQHEELQSSTHHFASENLIGKGGNSQVYKGSLPEGQEVAIKLSKLSDDSSKDFLLEVDIITKLQHEHIVPLMGICIENNNLFSVYKYFSKGSLEENLHGKRAKPPLTWEKRFKVAIGVAEALNYIHDGCARPVVHRDVKSSNILLTNEFEPKLSDFGLAIWAPTTSSYQTNNDVVGTFGYLAPEYFMYGKVSSKIDVYAYGVVLLELLTGRKPINDESPKGQESLVMWAIPILERGEFMEHLDPNLDGKYDEDQVQRMVLAASLCITRAARLRPRMSQVLSLLRGEQEIKSWMNSEAKNNLNEPDFHDDEAYPPSSVGSHLGLALLDVEDDASVISFEQSQLSSLDEYLSRSSSFD